MGQPRPGRRKAVVVSSDEDDAESVTVEDILSESDDNSKKRTATKVQADVSCRTRGATPKPLSTTSKMTSKSAATTTRSRITKGKPRMAPEPPDSKRTNKPIYSFFNAATQRQQSQPTPSPEKPRASQDALHEDVPDDFLDDISGDDTAVPFSTASHTVLAVRKRRLHDEYLESSVGDEAPPPTQKFRKISDGGRVSVKSSTEDQRPWTDRFPPMDLSELAVHKKKVHDVRNVLESAISSRVAPRLIVLKGPAGSAKTTTVNLLAKDLGADILEWKNPAGSDGSSGVSVPASAQFDDFVLRSGQYAGLPMATSNGGLATSVASDTKNEMAQIMVMEEFPNMNTFARSSTVLQSFRSTILQFLATPRSPVAKPTPLVMIISEALLSTSTATADSFTAHRLLGPQILAHPLTAEIEFNPVATTYLTKALDLIVVKEARKSGRRKTPGPQVLKHIAETGDVRSAVSSLEFLCVRGDEGEMWSAKVAFTKPKGNKRDVALTKQEQDALKLISNRESSLGIFHAVGKVVYNKRQLPEHPVPQPPNNLPQHRRLKVPETDVDVLINELGTDTSTFIAALHENYALSCTSTSSEESLDSLNGCIDALSDSDLLSLDRFGFGTRAYSGSAQDNLRQDDMSFQTAVRGLLFSLPSPVHRGEGGKKGSAFKMFYPTSLKIWKRKEELEGSLDMVIQSLQSDVGAHGISRPGSGRKDGVEAWKRSANLNTADSSHMEHDEPSSLLSTNSSMAKTKMLLDRLPYTSQILSRRADASSSLLSDLSALTSFQGEIPDVTDLEDEDDGPSQIFAGDVHWTADGPTGKSASYLNKTAQWKGTGRQGKEGGGLNIPVEHAVEKLVLSDDDIEDD